MIDIGPFNNKLEYLAWYTRCYGLLETIKYIITGKLL